MAKIENSYTHLPAYQEGYESRPKLSGDKRFSNPYPVGSIRHNAYKAGKEKQKRERRKEPR